MQFLVLILSALFALSGCGFGIDLPDSVDTKALALHELGHAQDLCHSSDSSSIMYPRVPHGRGLTSDAIAAAAAFEIPPRCFSLATLPVDFAARVAAAMADWNAVLPEPRFSSSSDCLNPITLGPLPPDCGHDACTTISGESVQIVFRADAHWD